MSRADGDRRRQLIALIVVVVVLAGLVGAIGYTYLTRGNGSTASATATGDGSSSDSQAGSGSSADRPAEGVGRTVTGEPVSIVLLVARGTEGDEFTPSVGKDVSGITPVSAPTSTGLAEVSGDAVGLYGGTLDESTCDRTQLADYLEAHPAKAEAWAGVLGIDPQSIRDHLVTLTPMILRTDTLVMNHGFYDGAVNAFASILQAGTAVLVDEFGVPSVRCFCGNPLTAAPDLAPGATFAGPAWQGWDKASTVRVARSPSRVGGFTLVNEETDSTFVRPSGSGGADDAPSDVPVPAGIPAVVIDPGPMSPATPEASTPSAEAPVAAGRPEGDPELLFEVGSLAGVSSGPTKPTTFSWEAAAYVTSITTYHYLNGGAPPGTIALRSADGTVHGPWPAVGSVGQGDVANAYWTVSPEVVIPAGTYTVVDSDPSTWSWALDTDQRGITSIQGIWLAEGAPADGSDGCAAYPEGSLMWTLCQHDPTADQAVPDGG
ncbi:MAG: hypothetical protein Q8M17_06075 [Actinomycetota bacterium]|nr:hypothetical protein [Actinomycetota bacterium]